MEYSSGQSAPIAEAAGCSKSSTSDGGGATSGLLVGYGPRNFIQEVGAFYKEVCAPTDAMDVESDEDEGIIAPYEDWHLILCLLHS